MAEMPNEVTNVSNLRDVVHCGVTMRMGMDHEDGQDVVPGGPM